MSAPDRFPGSRAMGISRLLALVFSFALLDATQGLAQQQKTSSSEVTTQETEPSFKIQVERNLVTVRVVVRTAKGDVVRNLTKEDFRLLDNGKPQVIAHFTVEIPAARVANETKKEAAAAPSVENESVPATIRSSNAPQSFTALYFDDVHTNNEDLIRTRDAAEHFLTSYLTGGDRVGIFTASGQFILDFTADRGKIHDALFHLRARPIAPRELSACPDISPYQAYLIVHEHDNVTNALDIATEETLHCQFGGDRRFIYQAQGQAQSDAVRVLNFSESEGIAALRGLDVVVRRMMVLPGQRSIVLISPGFLSTTLKSEINDVVEKALRSNVIINTFDAKGLFVTIPGGDASTEGAFIPGRPDLTGNKLMIELASIDRNAEVLRDTAYDTGGLFFHNSNDLEKGFRELNGFPEVFYILGFSPSNLKFDGHFHNLKVELVSPSHYLLQARRGYFAPKQPPDAALRAQEEIEDAVFSQQELNGLPVQINTQFFKNGDQQAKLSVLLYVDVRFLSFRKQEGRHLENLTVVTAVFDADGKIVNSIEKRVEMRLKDATLERLSRSGLSMKTSFDVKPGTYMIREVVRDAEGGQLSGVSRTIDIPF